MLPLQFIILCHHYRGQEEFSTMYFKLPNFNYFLLRKHKHHHLDCYTQSLSLPWWGRRISAGLWSGLFPCHHRWCTPKAHLSQSPIWSRETRPRHSGTSHLWLGSSPLMGKKHAKLTATTLNAAWLMIKNKSTRRNKDQSWLKLKLINTRRCISLQTSGSFSGELERIKFSMPRRAYQ